MRTSLLFLAATSLVVLAPQAQAQNYVQIRDYAKPGVMVNMDVLGSPSMDPMVAPAPMYSAPLPPPVQLRPPVPMAQPAMQPVIQQAPRSIAPPAMPPMVGQEPELIKQTESYFVPAVIHPKYKEQAPVPVPAQRAKSTTKTVVTPGPAKTLNDDFNAMPPIKSEPKPLPPISTPISSSAPAMPSPIASMNDDNAGRVVPAPMEAPREVVTPTTIARTMQTEDLPPPAPMAAKPVMPAPSEPLALTPAPKAPVVEKPVAKKDNFEAYRVLFDARSTELKPAEQGVLNKIVNIMKAEPDTKLQVQAYAGGTPETAAQARRLSLARALKVRTYMTGKGIAAPRMDIRALGMGSAAMGDQARGDIPADRMDIIFVR